MPVKTVTRRRFLSAAAATAAGFPALPRKAGSLFAISGATTWNPPRSPRAKWNFNPDWRFIREDVPGAEAPGFDDRAWSVVSTPHSFNDVDSFRKIISHSGGDLGTYKGIAWYRKHFKLPASLSGCKIFLEFEGMRQAGDIFLNGKHVGLSENGVTAYGIDITNGVNFRSSENVLAVKVDNRLDYLERATGTRFEWNANDFNPDHGGIRGHVWLHTTSKVYQTLPLFYGLKTSGVYVRAANFDIPGARADVVVDTEARNESDSAARIGLSVVVVDRTGRVSARFDGDKVELAPGATAILTARGRMTEVRFWSPDVPYLYDVYSILEANGKVADVEKTVTGFRKTEFKGGAGKGGVYLNDSFIYLKGFAQRATNEWAALGQAYPDWLHDYNASLIRACHGNYIRWMHVSPQKIDADSMARYGIIQICPAGDKERDVPGRQWEQRVEVMRASMIYFRNNPSILFYEAGNTVVTPEQMEQMVGLRNQWDPDGGRLVGYRDNDDIAANAALTPLSEYYEVMIGEDSRTDALTDPKAMFRGYSGQRRDRAPIIEAEDFRDEGARRFWDDYSPPFYRAKKGPLDTYMINSEYLYNSESFALAGVARYWAYWMNRISNPDPAHSKWSGYASIYFSDSDADGRQDSSEVCRVSGKLDAVRLPKQLYFAHRVMQNPQPDLHILGHWSYPLLQPMISGQPAQKTVKTVYVIANSEEVELFLNGRSLGVNSTPANGYVFAFPRVTFVAGALSAEGRNAGTIVATHKLVTAGPPVALKLTQITGPQGLQADGQDVAVIDFEVVDAAGEQCPTDYGRVDFAISGPGVWRGGYNSGIVDSTNNLYLNTECGINRVFIRSTLSPGTITVTANRRGLNPDTVRIASKSVIVTDGISPLTPQFFEGPLDR